MTGPAPSWQATAGPVPHRTPPLERKDVAAMKATHQPPTRDHEPGTSPADLLRGAALYLRRYGWTRGQFFDLLADTDGPFPPACASGAITTAAHGRCLATGICTLDGDEDPETVAAIAAMRVFAAYLDLEYTGSGYDTSA